MVGGDDEVHKKIPKLVNFKLDIPAGYHNSFTFTVENTNFDDPAIQVDFCNLAIVTAGNNLPCIHAYDDSSTERKLNDGADFMKQVEE